MLADRKDAVLALSDDIRVTIRHLSGLSESFHQQLVVTLWFSVLTSCAFQVEVILINIHIYSPLSDKLSIKSRIATTWLYDASRNQ